MYTLVEANKLNQDVLQKAVVETFARTSSVLENLPFSTVNGNSYSYNVETGIGNVEFRPINGTYTESTGTSERKTETLAILGGEAKVDKYLVATANLTDLRALEVERKSKAMAKAFTEKFINGDSSTDTNAFNGLKKRVVADQIVTATGELTLNDLHELLDKVDGGADALVMTKSMKREIQRVFDLHPSYVQVGTDAFGRTVTMFNDVKILTIDDTIIPFDPSAGGDIYAVKWGAEGVAGLQNGPMQVTDVGELETAPQYLTRIEWYVALAVFNDKSLAKLTGVKRAV